MSTVISTGQRLAGLGALVAMLGLVLGVPYALWQAGGTPWPDTAPSSDWLTQPMQTSSIMAVLVAVLWLAWLHFCVCLAVEFVNERRPGGAKHHVPGGSVGTASLARRLVAAVLLLAGSAAVSVPAASAATHEVASSSVSASSGVFTGGRPDGAHDSRMGGSATQVADSTAQAAPRALVRTGKELACVVQPHHGRHYDSLWALAERYLGDGRRWREIYDLNKFVLQDDGSRLQDPDLILPGWKLVLPADAKGPDVKRFADLDKGGQDGTHAQQSVLRDGGTGPSVDGALAGVGDIADVSDQQQSASDLAAQLGVAGGFVAAALLLGLRRRRGWHGGGGGGGGLRPSDEEGLRLAADHPGAIMVDRGLRGLAEGLADSQRPFPAVHSAKANPTGLTLEMLTPVPFAPPDGWRSEADGRRWVTDRAHIDRTEPAVTTQAPCPGLVSVGTDGESIILLNFGAAPGIVALNGDVEAGQDVGRSLTVELATNVWSDAGTVTLVGLGEDLSAVAPDRLRHADSIDEVLEQLSEPGSGSHFVVLGLAPTPEQERALADLMAQRQHLGVLAFGEMAGAGWRLTVTADGRLTSHLLGLDVAAQTLTRSAFERITAMFAEAEHEGRGATTSVALAEIPGFDARMLDEEFAAPVTVRLLGPVEVSAPGTIDAERIEQATEIVAYVALSPAGVHPTVLRSAIWPRGANDDVCEAALGHVRAWLGSNADGSERLRVSDDGRWSLDLAAVRVDWHVLRALVARAAAATDPTLDLASALSCVDGAVMDVPAAHRYGWLARSTLLRDMQVTIVDAALSLAQMATTAGRNDLAHEALRTGLDCVPGCEELWQAELELTASDGDKQVTEVTAGEMYAAIARHGSPRGATAQTDSLVDELLPGFGRRGARATRVA